MTRLKPPHVLIPSDDLNGWAGDNNLIQVRIECDRTGTEVPLKLLFDISYSFGGISQHFYHNMFFTIPDDCWVEISLGKSCENILDWYSEYLPWTGKRNHGSHYGKISFDQANNLLKFKAKAKSGPWSKDGFNLNLGMHQGNGIDPATGNYGPLPLLPVTFDPDVINPRPPGLYPADSDVIFKAMVKNADGNDIEEYFLRSELIPDS